MFGCGTLLVNPRHPKPRPEFCIVLPLVGCFTFFGFPSGLCRNYFPAFGGAATAGARRMFLTVKVIWGTASVDTPTAAWLLITRGSVMCVITVSLSTRRSGSLGFGLGADVLWSACV
jgi:hypothetical protein